MKGDKQFRRALELGAAFTLRLERGTDGGVVCRLKDLRTRQERVGSVGEALKALAC